MAQPSPKPGRSPVPEISVVIPVHNASKTLRACLESVCTNSGVEFEIIVVDDASSDDSVKIALEFPCRVIALQANIMAANCRNLGARHATGDILVFFDSDQVMPPDTLRRYLAVLRHNPEADAVVGSLQADTPIPGYFSKFKNFRHHYVHQTAAREGATLASGLTAIRRGVFMEFGGFEPAYWAASIEDIALGYKLRRAHRHIRFVPEIQITHLKGYTFRSLLSSDIRHRAIPWTGLMIRERMWRNDLNTRHGNVLSVVLAWSLPLIAVFAGLKTCVPAALGSLALLWAANAGLLGAARLHFGWGFLAKSLAFLPVMYFYQGVGLVAGIWSYATGKSPVLRGAPARDIDYRVLEGFHFQAEA